MKIAKLNLRSRQGRADSPKGRLNRILVVVSVISGALALGCELIVDFDRTRIPVEATEGGSIDASIDAPATASDAGDAAPTDASDAGEDADAGITDAATDG